VAAIPTIEALGATIAGGVATPFVRIDGVDHPVTFNVLRPAETIVGIGDLVAKLLVDGAD
jgi:hypothetical protein